MGSDSWEEIMAQAKAAREARPTQWPCDKHGPYASATDDGRGLVDECPMCIVDAEHQKSAWRLEWARWDNWSAAGVPQRFTNRCLENWRPRTATQTKALKAIRSWLRQNDLGGLLLSGRPGVGKTHLAVAIALESARAGLSVRYVAVPDLLQRLRASFDRGSEARTESILDELHRVHVLILDEVAATRGTDWERETLSALVDDRYRDGGKLVIATNATPDELPKWIGERAADRLAEFALVLVIDGDSYRSLAHTDEALRSAATPFLKPSYEIEVVVMCAGKPRERTFAHDQGRML